MAKKLKADLGISAKFDHYDITDILRSNDLVIPNEEPVIRSMFKAYLSKELREEFCIVFDDIKNDNDEICNGAIGGRIYAIRNRIVHHPLSASTKKSLNDNSVQLDKMKRYDWDHLCRLLLKSYLHFKRHIPADP